MLVVFWILNGLLALVFLGAGLSKIARPKDALASSGMGFVVDLSGTQVKLIGLAEVIGAVGLILPFLLNVAEVLTPIASIALAIAMIVAVTVHLRRKESPVAPLLLAVLSIISAILAFTLL